MRRCCPPNHGCNAPGGAEICALELCRTAAAADRQAALALERWAMLEQARDGQRRFRRRAYQRSRDRALVALAFAGSVAPGGTDRDSAVSGTDEAPRSRRRMRRAARHGESASPREPESRVRSSDGAVTAAPRRSPRR